MDVRVMKKYTVNNVALERIVESLDITQTEGVFGVPEKFDNDFGIKRWINSVRRYAEKNEKSLVVYEETSYYRESITKKIKIGLPLVTRLSKFGFIRPLEGDDFSYTTCRSEPVDPLSIAQTFSWALNIPIEQILIHEDNKTKRMLRQKANKERMDILFNAYKGCRWFEDFLRRHKPKENNKIPAVEEWQRISRADLEQFFISSNNTNGTIRKLCEKGFLIPAEGSHGIYRSKSLNNIVDNENLAEFISRVFGVDKKEVFTKHKNQFNELEPIVASYLSNRLIPYLNRKRIAPKNAYAIKEAANVTGQKYHRIYWAVKTGALHASRKNENSETSIKGVDLAIYILKETQRKRFTEKSIAWLFGLDLLNPITYEMKVTKNRTYSRHHYVFPFYDEIAGRAKRRLTVMKTQAPGKLSLSSGQTLNISKRAKQKYCREYDVLTFDDVCRDHVREQLAGVADNSLDGEVVSEDLVFKIKNRTIMSIYIKEKDFQVCRYAGY